MVKILKKKDRNAMVIIEKKKLMMFNLSGKFTLYVLVNYIPV